MDNEVWRIIPEFPQYSVSTHGRVRNNKTDYKLAQLRNQAGVINVGLMRDLVQHKRSVAVLVASAFVPNDKRYFDAPINLDGDRYNNHVANLVWRPRWFAVKYFQQFHNNLRGFRVPVVEVNSGEEFETSWVAAVKYGLIDRDILIATANRTYVWPSYQVYRVI